MPKKQPDLDDLGAQFRDAQAGIAACRAIEVQVDMERMSWLARHRGVPADVLYDRTTGDPIHPDLIDLEARMAKAAADTLWCQAVMLACGEAFKGEPLQEVLERNAKHRQKVRTKPATMAGG